jgi:hypothetical protein
MPGTRLREGFAGLSVSGRRSFSEDGKPGHDEFVARPNQTGRICDSRARQAGEEHTSLLQTLMKSGLAGGASVTGQQKYRKQPHAK